MGKGSPLFGVFPLFLPLMVASSDMVRSDREFRAREKDMPALFLEWMYLEKQETSQTHRWKTTTKAVASQLLLKY